MNPLGDLQRALFALLKTSLSVPVYDEVLGAAPYVTIGEAWTTPFDTHSRTGFTADFDIDVWSRHRGYSEANRIASDVIAVVHHQWLTVPGWTSPTRMRVLRTQAMRDPDPDTDVRHVAIACRCWLQAPVLIPEPREA